MTSTAQLQRSSEKVSNVSSVFWYVLIYLNSYILLWLMDGNCTWFWVLHNYYSTFTCTVWLIHIFCKIWFPVAKICFIFQWTEVFPNEIKTQQKSALFVKKLLAVAVSNITYLRAIFPEVAFGDRCLEGFIHAVLLFFALAEFNFMSRDVRWCIFKACICVTDLTLKVLKDESSCPGACQVIKWVKGCFDALDKKYVSWKCYTYILNELYNYAIIFIQCNVCNCGNNSFSIN